MYQNEMKEGFIKDYLRSRVIQKTTLYGLFRKIEPYEKELSKDVSQLNKEEALAMYVGLKARSVYTLMNDNTILKAYCAWVQHYHGLENSIAYEDISIDDLKLCIDKNASKLLSREESHEIEDQLLNWTDKAILQCLFEGISGQSMRDITELNNSMLDMANNRLVFPDGRVFNISSRLCELLDEAFQEETYICYGETLRAKKLQGKGKLFKERDNAYAEDSDDKRFRMVYRKIQVVRKYVAIKELTMKNIAASGFVYYLRNQIHNTGLGLKEYLRTESGEQLMERYGYCSEFRIDNIIHRFKKFI